MLWTFWSGCLKDIGVFAKLNLCDFCTLVMKSCGRISVGLESLKGYIAGYKYLDQATYSVIFGQSIHTHPSVGLYISLIHSDPCACVPSTLRVSLILTKPSNRSQLLNKWFQLHRAPCHLHWQTCIMIAYICKKYLDHDMVHFGVILDSIWHYLHMWDRVIATGSCNNFMSWINVHLSRDIFGDFMQPFVTT